MRYVQFAVRRSLCTRRKHAARQKASCHHCCQGSYTQTPKEPPPYPSRTYLSPGLVCPNINQLKADSAKARSQRSFGSWGPHAVKGHRENTFQHTTRSDEGTMCVFVSKLGELPLVFALPVQLENSNFYELLLVGPLSCFILWYSEADCPTHQAATASVCLQGSTPAILAQREEARPLGSPVFGWEGSGPLLK